MLAVGPIDSAVLKIGYKQTDRQTCKIYILILKKTEIFFFVHIKFGLIIQNNLKIFSFIFLPYLPLVWLNDVFTSSWIWQCVCKGWLKDWIPAKWLNIMISSSQVTLLCLDGIRYGQKGLKFNHDTHNLNCPPNFQIPYFFLESWT